MRLARAILCPGEGARAPAAHLDEPAGRVGKFRAGGPPAPCYARARVPDVNGGARKILPRKKPRTKITLKEVIYLKRSHIVKPPYYNMGVQPTKEQRKNLTNNKVSRDLICLFDWISFTIKKNISLDIIISDFLKMSSEDFIELDKGNYGYKRQVANGNVRIYFEGKEDMGIHIQLSGQGCRQVEDSINGDWLTLFKKIFDVEGTFTRLDLAVDDFIGVLDITKIQKKTERKEYISRFTNWEIRTSCKNDSNKYGKSVYFGSAQSDIRLRFYDKATEQEIENLHWVRTELQMRNERANNAIQIYLSGKTIGEIVTGVLKNYIRFVDPSSTDKNKWRWNTSKFWSEFIAGAEKIRLTNGQKKRTLDDVYTWINKAVAPSLALLVKASEGDFSIIEDMVIEASKRLKPKHLALLTDEWEREKQMDLILQG